MAKDAKGAKGAKPKTKKKTEKVAHEEIIVIDGATDEVAARLHVSDTDNAVLDESENAVENNADSDVLEVNSNGSIVVSNSEGDPEIISGYDLGESKIEDVISNDQTTDDDSDDEDSPKTKTVFEPKDIVALGARRFDEFEDIKLTKKEREEKVSELLRIMDEHDADERKKKAETAEFNSRAKQRESDASEIRQLLRKSNKRELMPKWRIEGWRFIKNASPELIESSKVNVENDGKFWLIFDEKGKIIERDTLPFSKLENTEDKSESTEEPAKVFPMLTLVTPETNEEQTTSDEVVTEPLPDLTDDEEDAVMNEAVKLADAETNTSDNDTWDDVIQPAPDKAEAVAASPDTAVTYDDLPF